MLQSAKIQHRQSEIRQALAGLVAKDKLDETETRSMETLDAEYRGNETKFRAALIVEDTERREAKDDLETRSEKDFADLIGKFEVRQIVKALDEGAKLTGETAEVVTELRNAGGYQGMPVPYAALEIRSGETVASGVPAPKVTQPIIDRLFAASAASRMGAQMISIAQGSQEYPLTSSAVTGAWQSSETGGVGGPTAYSTAQRTLAPNNTFGIQMKITRKSLLQNGAGLEQAVRRDMLGCLNEGLDKAVFLGAGSGGEPAGILVGSYSITSTGIGAAASWAAFRSAVVRFMTDNAIASPSDVKLLIRPEIWNGMDGDLITNTAVSEWDRMVANLGADSVVMSANALAAPAGSPLASKALLTCSPGGVAPIFVGMWGAVDMIRDPYSDAASGGLRITGLVTMDVSAGRAKQLQILTGVQ